MVPPDHHPLNDVLPSTGAAETAARAVATSSSLETLSRPFLDVLHTLTGLESTYLSEVRTDDDLYTVRFADNRGEIVIAEGTEVSWSTSLCRDAYVSGTPVTSDAVTAFPDSPLPTALGIGTFVSVPVMGPDDRLMGTLCGLSSGSVAVPEHAMDMMTMLARLIADQWERDRLHDDAVERARVAEQRLRERATFLAEAEHKLKSPLTIVRGWSELLAEDWPVMDDPERTEAFGILRRASTDAARQLDELLQEARSEVLSRQLVPVRVPVADLVREVARQLEGAAGPGLTVSAVRIDPADVLADREALWQVLWHLAENAVKYSPGGGRIELRVVRVDDRVEISVSDEGLGVPEGIDVFAPFTRGGPEHVGAIPGTGLGLHIVQNLSHALGGTVGWSRRTGAGTVFTVRLPLASPPRSGQDSIHVRIR